MSVVVLTVIISIAVAYVLTRFKVPAKSLIFSTILYAYMFPPLLLAIPMYGFFVKLGIADTLLALEQRLQYVRENLRTPELREEFALANRFRQRR